jgi:LPXTG-motif cell wall-anchored protein
MQIASVVDYVITGAGTKEGSHTFTINANSTIQVDSAGKALPVVATSTLPNTTWTPVNDTTPVVFTEKSFKIVATLDLSATLGDVVIDTFVCVPSSAPTILSLGAQGPPPTVTTTTLAPLTSTLAPVTTAAAPPVGVAPTALPRTGSTSSLLFVIAVGCLSLGLFAVKTSSRKRAKSRP